MVNSEEVCVDDYSLFTQFFTLWWPKTAAMPDRQGCLTFVSVLETFCFFGRNNLFLRWKHFISLVETKRKHYSWGCKECQVISEFSPESE